MLDGTPYGPDARSRGPPARKDGGSATASTASGPASLAASLAATAPGVTADYAWLDEEEVDDTMRRLRAEIEAERRQFISSRLGRPFNERLATRPSESRPRSSAEEVRPDFLSASLLHDLDLDPPSTEAMREELQRGRLEFMMQLQGEEPGGMPLVAGLAS